MTRGDVYLSIDRTRTLSEEPEKGHNRWHPDIPPILEVRQGQVVGVETRDAFDGQFTAKTTANKVRGVNLNVVHPLTGPIYIDGAEPGDILEVSIADIHVGTFGYTAQVPGFGFLRDIFTEPFFVRWGISDGYATSGDLPGVRIPGAPFMGVMGLAPSIELLNLINKRETDLSKRGGNVLLPNIADAVPQSPSISSTAIRTIAPHEVGGNLDIKQLTKGAKIRLPVY